MLWKIFVLTLLALVIHRICNIIYVLEFHKAVYNHQPGKCRLVPGVDHGSEDMETLANGLTFITSGIMLPSFSDVAKKYYKDHNVRGRILLFDFNNPDKNAIELKITGEFNQTDFFPHGISLWQDPSSGRLLIYVVNHGSLDDTIEKFEYKDDKKELQHLHTYKDPAIHFVNDVVVLEEEKFYFTNFAYFRHKFGGVLEGLLSFHTGYIVYYDGNKYTKVADGFLLANGLALSLNKKKQNTPGVIFYDNVSISNFRYLYMCTAKKDMKIFERKDNGELILKQEVQLYSQPDNPVVDRATGNVLIGGHPVGHKCIEHLDDPSKPAGSQVLMLHMDKSGSNVTGITELYSDDGHTLHASSSASLYKKQLLIGTVKHKLMYCRVETL